MKIESVEFVRSATGAGDLPGRSNAAAAPLDVARGASSGSRNASGTRHDNELPEIAMAGRSNVGKSSLINALLKTTVARTSATPGKTRLINLYRVVTKPTGPFYLVDLPGYGFTKGKDNKETFNRMAALYFSREAAVGVILAVDCRHPGMENDLATCSWLRSRGFDPLVVVTKLDKLSRNVRAKSLREFDHLFGTAVVGVSAETGEGMEDLWKRILSWILSAATGSSPSRSRL